MNILENTKYQISCEILALHPGPFCATSYLVQKGPVSFYSRKTISFVKFVHYTRMLMKFLHSFLIRLKICLHLWRNLFSLKICSLRWLTRCTIRIKTHLCRLSTNMAAISHKSYFYPVFCSFIHQILLIFCCKLIKDIKINKVHQKLNIFCSFSWTVKLEQQGCFGTIEWHRVL